MQSALRIAAMVALIASLLWASRPGLAQAPAFLLKDINRRPIGGSSSPSRFIAIGDLAFFTANDPDGPGLWRTDGSEAGTVRLISGVAVDHLVDVGGTLFCVATAGDDTTLWTSDGTPGGTRQIAEIPAIGGDRGYSFDYDSVFTTIGQMLFFVTGNFQIGFDLWRSDGTPTGTIRLRRLDPTTGGASGPWFRVLGGTLLFTSWDDATGYEPWRTDGTPEGTMLLRDVAPGTESSSPDPLIVTANGLLLFGAYQLNIGDQLWATDGTPEGTTRVSEAQPYRGYEARAVEIDGTVYFTAALVENNVAYLRLWQTDGTAANTRLVDDAAHITAWAVGAAGKVLFLFGQHEDTPRIELFASDGATQGLQSRFAFPADGVIPTPLMGRDGLLYFRPDFRRQQELWRSDGTAAGTFALAPAVSSDLIPFRDALYFLGATQTGPFGEQFASLWTTDGTTAGTARVTGPELRVAVTETITAGDTMLFFSADDGRTGFEPWKSDGTAAGTTAVANLMPERDTLSASPYGFTKLNDSVLFVADDGQVGAELWRSDGTADGTVLLKDINPGPPSSFISGFLPSGTVAYFAARDDAAGLGLWKTDGTEDGTLRVASIAPEKDSSSGGLTTLSGRLFLSVSNPTGPGALWTSDGTETGTLPVTTTGATPMNLTSFNGALFFTIGAELWKSDGTPDGTVRVDFLPAAGIDQMAAVDGTLFLSIGPDPAYRDQLWTSDGTAAGTVPVATVEGSLPPGNLFPAGHLLFLLAETDREGLRLWRTDGSAAGTFPLARVEFSYVSTWAPTVLGDELWYGTYGGLFNSDGTRAGSQHIAPHPLIYGLTAVGNTLMFEGCTFSSGYYPEGCEVWESNGTADGTRMLAEIDRRDPFSPSAPGVAAGDHVRIGSYPDGFTAVGSVVVFAAETGDLGRELWAIPLAALGQCGDGEVDPGEGCDDGGETATCNSDCYVSFCGDEVVNATAGELCEPDQPCCGNACTFQDSGTSCSNGNLCDGEGTCTGAGNCMAGTPLTCDDQNSDTIDTCEPYYGCRHGCPGDCDGHGAVSIDELVSIVNIALSGSASNNRCLAATDADADGTITVDEIIKAVTQALYGCGDR